MKQQSEPNRWWYLLPVAITGLFLTAARLSGGGADRIGATATMGRVVEPGLLRWRRFGLMTIASVLMAVGAGIFTAITPPEDFLIHRPPGRVAVQVANTARNPVEGGERSVSIKVDKEKLSVSAEVVLPPDSQLSTDALTGVASRDPQKYFERTIGDLRLLQTRMLGADDPWYYQRLALRTLTAKAREDGNVAIRMAMEDVYVYGPNVRFWLNRDKSKAIHYKVDLVHVLGASGRVYLDPGGYQLHKVVSTDEDTRIDRALDPQSEVLNFSVGIESNDGQVSRLWAAGEMVIAALDNTTWRLATLVLPLAILIWALTQTQLVQDQRMESTWRLLTVLLALNGGVTILGFIEVLAAGPLWDWSWNLLWSDWGSFHPDSGPLGAIVGAAIVLWPLVVFRSSENSLRRPAALDRRGTATLVGGGLIWFVLAVITWRGRVLSNGPATMDELRPSNLHIPAIVSLVISLCAVILAATIIVRLAWPTGHAISTVVLASTLGTLVLASSLISGRWLLVTEESHLNAVARIVGLVLCLSIVTGLSWAIFVWATKTFVTSATHRSWAIVRIATPLLVVLATLPWTLSQVLDRGLNSANVWSGFALADSLRSLIYALEAICLFVVLRELDKAPEIMRVHSKRVMMIVYGLINFYWFDDLWFYLPIQVLVGGILLVFVAFPESQTAMMDTSHYQPLRSMRPKIREAQSWSDGVLGAWLGLIAGLPWTVVYITSVGDRPPSSADYPVLEFLGYQVLVLIQWTMYGFAFGYGYPLWRGANAFTKALALFITAVVPLSVTTVLRWEPQELKSFLFFVLEMLIFCLILAAAFAIIALRRDDGLDWSAIRERYGLGARVAWGSTILAAIGGIITTAVSGGLTEVASSVFSQVAGGPPSRP